MPEYEINGISVNFPFEPYEVQKVYMEKVIECLQNGKNGVLESPTGTGKTLSLLCSSLGWLMVKKAQLQSQMLSVVSDNPSFSNQYFQDLTKGLDKAAGKTNQSTTVNWTMPKIIYASRTHSQLSQAMGELKRTSYKHVKVAVLGSRDQLCIHPEVSKEPNTSAKIHMCQAKVKARTCFYYNNVESRKLEPIFTQDILDIEDLVKTSQKLRCCPYFLSKELKQNADISFMPYNYILDPKSRKALGVELQNNILLLDEAHNVEKTCEESASLQISSTDIALCIDEITSVMKEMANDAVQGDFTFEKGNNSQTDFSPEDLCILKSMFLNFEKAVDSMEITNSEEGDTFPGGYIFDLMEKAELTHGKESLVIEKLDKIILYLTTTSTSPFTRKGNGLQKFNDLLRVVFSGSQGSLNHRERVKRCYKVHARMEESKKNQKHDSWELKNSVKKNEGKVISYWCFSPGFGMQQIVEQGIRSIILTSGTLSPLKPLISELDIPIDVTLENPHIVTGRQVCVGILSQGPDGHQLNSSFNTRNDPKYVASLGRTIYNFSCLVPHGMLVFFPSYPILKKCQDDWQSSGLWTKIADRKAIYVEGRSKDGFANTMSEFYKSIQDPACRGAIFMAVCRGKVSEGLDFADINGRAVLITGLPYPPLKEPRIMLKQRYLEENRKNNREAMTGQQWYQLEASRAVNQAIGRVIRHKNDYGAIILCDCRFENPNFKRQLSSWLQPHLKKFTNFGMITKELREFFRGAERDLPQTKSNCRVSYDNLVTGLPAVPVAAFGKTNSRISLPVLKENLGTSTVLVDDCDIYADIYKKSLQEEPSPIPEKKSIFTAKTFGKPEIDFSKCKLDANWTRCELTRGFDEPVAKKRKFQISDNNLLHDAPSSSSSDSLSRPVNHSELVALDGCKKPVSNAKKEVGKNYLKEVKRSLSDVMYKRFTVMIQQYTKNSDFDQLITTLEMLFPRKDNLQHLLKGFKSFLKKQHITAFDNHVKLLEDLNL